MIHVLSYLGERCETPIDTTLPFFSPLNDSYIGNTGIQFTPEQLYGYKILESKGNFIWEHLLLSPDKADPRYSRTRSGERVTVYPVLTKVHNPKRKLCTILVPIRPVSSFRFEFERERIPEQTALTVLLKDGGCGNIQDVRELQYERLTGLTPLDTVLAGEDLCGLKNLVDMGQMSAATSWLQRYYKSLWDITSDMAMRLGRTDHYGCIGMHNIFKMANSHAVRTLSTDEDSTMAVKNSETWPTDENTVYGAVMLINMLHSCACSDLSCSLERKTGKFHIDYAHHQYFNKGSAGVERLRYFLPSMFPNRPWDSIVITKNWNERITVTLKFNSTEIYYHLDGLLHGGIGATCLLNWNT